MVKTPEEVKSLEAKLCETLLTLGEVSLESENYEQAVADITECLNMRKVRDDYYMIFTFIEFSCFSLGVQSYLPADSRRIAETYYHLGVALILHDKFNSAVSPCEFRAPCQLTAGGLRRPTTTWVWLQSSTTSLIQLFLLVCSELPPS